MGSSIKGIISKAQEAEFLSQLIKKNFRFVRFNSHHLFERLKYILSMKGKGFTYDDLKHDDIFNTFFIQFGDASLESRSLIHMATDVWLMIFKDERIGRDFKASFVNDLVVSTMYLPTFSYSYNKADGEVRIAHIWAVFLWRAYNERIDYFLRAWSCIKSCCERMFSQDEEKCERILFNHLPGILGKLIDNDIESPTDKISTLYKLTGQLDDLDKEKFEIFYVQNPPPFMNTKH